MQVTSRGTTQAASLQVFKFPIANLILISDFRIPILIGTPPARDGAGGAVMQTFSVRSDYVALYIIAQKNTLMD
jgi:hypothetical protein